VGEGEAEIVELEGAERRHFCGILVVLLLLWKSLEVWKDEAGG
jgi:hypothetical protein